MKLYDVIQFFIVASAILWSALYAVGRVAPSWRKRAAFWLQQTSHPRWLQAIGGRLSGGSGCGAGCDACGSCAPKNNQPLDLTSAQIIEVVNKR